MTERFLGRGGSSYRVILSSLPPEAQARYWMGLTNTTPDTIERLKAWLASRQIFLSPRELADPETQKKIACARAYHNAPWGARAKVLGALAKTCGKSSLQIWRWVTSIDNHIRTAPVISVGGRQIEIPKTRAFDPEALAFGIAYRARHMQQGVQVAYDAMKQYAGDPNLRIGDYTSFWRILQKIPDAIWTYLLKGPIGFEAECIPKIIRRWTEIPVQSVLCGDQEIVDWALRNPAHEVEILNGHVWMDCASRFINGASIKIGHYNSWTVGSALKMALTYGIPDGIYTDWGKPEGSKHIAHILKCLSDRNATTGSLAEMAANYSHAWDDVKHVKARQGKPWLKPIENINNIINHLLKDENIPGYRKRVQDAWENKEIQARLKAQARRGELMLTEEFVEKFFSVIDKHNRSVKKLREGGSIVPVKFFADGLRAQHRTVFDERTLDYICLPTYCRALRKDGRIQVKVGEEIRIYSSSLQGRKDQVEVSIDPYDGEAPAVISDLEGNYLDSAVHWKTQSFRDEKERARKWERQKGLMKWVSREAKRLRDGFGIIETSVVKITSKSETAKQAENAKKGHQARKEAQKAEEERIEEMKKEGMQKVKDMESAAPPVLTGLDKILPIGSKELYRYWLALRIKADGGEPVPEGLVEWYHSYPTSGDWAAEAALHESYREEYLDLPYPEGLTEEFSNRRWIGDRFIEIPKSKEDDKS